HRRGEVHLFAPGLGARFERQDGEECSGSRGIPQLDREQNLSCRDAQIHPPSVALHGDLVPPLSTVPSICRPFTWPLNSALRPASLKVSRSPRSLASSIRNSLPSRRTLPVMRVSCCLNESVAGCLLIAGGICAFQEPATLAGTM